MYKVKLPFSCKDGAFTSNEEVPKEVAEKYPQYVVEINEPKPIETKKRTKKKAE